MRSRDGWAEAVGSRLPAWRKEVEEAENGRVVAVGILPNSDFVKCCVWGRSGLSGSPARSASVLRFVGGSGTVEALLVTSHTS